MTAVPFFAKRPVSMFIPLNWAWLAMRLISSTSCDTSTWICIRSSEVYTPLAPCTASSRMRWMMSWVSPR